MHLCLDQNDWPLLLILAYGFHVKIQLILESIRVLDQHSSSVYQTSFADMYGYIQCICGTMTSTVSRLRYMNES